MATASHSTNSPTIDQHLDLEKVLNEFFLILSEKEQTVITKRFALSNKPRETLEKIGKHFSVTRERIRQIESIALHKLRRNIGNTQLQKINNLAKEILSENGEIMKEKLLLAEILNITHLNQTPVTPSIMKLSLTIDPELEKIDTSKVYFPFWRNKQIPLKMIDKVANVSYKTLKKIGDVTNEKSLLEKIQKNLQEENFSPTFLTSILSIDRRFRKLEKNEWGLMEWRHVNPRSIRDKALICLERAEKPLHFIEISNRITGIGFDKKIVTTQACHNDLIRYPEFVLVGRGMYALAKWGYEPGTVADVIYKILKENGPMKKKDIVKTVMEQRDVQVGTISLNLQKNKAFERVGRAVYQLNEKNWAQPLRGRGRGRGNLIAKDI